MATQTPAQAHVQPSTPLQPSSQVQTPAQTQAPFQAAGPGQVPAQVAPQAQTQAQFPAQTQAPNGVASQEWRPGLERPASPAQSGLVVPPPDLEKTMLSTFCREFDLPLTMATDRLAARGITAFGDMTFQELALENNVTPDEVMRIIVTP
jgi:hypothetical protein